MLTDTAVYFLKFYKFISRNINKFYISFLSFILFAQLCLVGISSLLMIKQTQTIQRKTAYLLDLGLVITVKNLCMWVGCSINEVRAQEESFYLFIAYTT